MNKKPARLRKTVIVALRLRPDDLRTLNAARHRGESLSAFIRRRLGL